MSEPVNKAGSNLSEVGRSGLLISGGVVYEEFLTSLRGPRGRRALREMADNDPVVGGILLAYTQTICRLKWKFEVPEDASSDDQEICGFVQECWEDMSNDWPSTITSILSMMTYGWSFLEIVYKIRGGDNINPERKSRFTDGKIGWRKWAERSQESLQRWELGPDGGVVALTQIVYGQNSGDNTFGGEFTIPFEKGLLFRTTNSRGNPEGRSLLRNAYRPAFFKKRIEEIEAIGIERDLAGMPVAWLPPEYLSSTASPDQKALLATVQNIVKNIKRNELEGLVYPLVYDERGQKLIDLTLMNSGGTRQFDTDKIVARYNQQIAMSVLADFLMLGHEQVGTQSLGASKLDLWMMAVDAMAKSIAEVVNHYAVPRLLKLNGMDCENPPMLTYGDVDTPDLAALGTFIKAMSDAGIIVPDTVLEEHVRDLANLPPIDEETREDPGTQVPLTPEEMAAYTAVGAKPPMTKPLNNPAEKQDPGAVSKPNVKPGTSTEANAKAPAAKPGAKAPAKPVVRKPGVPK